MDLAPVTRPIPVAHAAPSDRDVRALARDAGPARLMEEAAALRDAWHGRFVTYSRKVFIPLTRL